MSNANETPATITTKDATMTTTTMTRPARRLPTVGDVLPSVAYAADKTWKVPTYTNEWKAAYGFNPASPLVVSYGRGVDSTAMLVEMQRRGIRPDLIIFSDTGAEKPETMAPAAGFDRWLESVGFPAVTVVAYHVHEARYHTLEGNCLQNDVLPSLSYGGHSCSKKWKIDSIDDAVWGVCGWAPAIDALTAGIQTIRAIGYDASPADTKRFDKQQKREAANDAAGLWSPWSNWYPLVGWKLERPALKAIIASVPELATLFDATAGRSCPVKSACFFCPASKEAEVLELGRKHPELVLRAAVMEFRSATGKHGLRTLNGLGLGREKGAAKGTRNFSWTRLLQANGLLSTDWRTEAEAAGLLPARAEWDAYSAEGVAARAVIANAEANLVAAQDAAPELAELLESTPAKHHAKITRVVATTISDPAAHELLAAIVELARVVKIKRNMVGPDWSAIARPVADKAKARERRQAMKLWRELVKAAAASHGRKPASGANDSMK
jgi:hypothetical protein